MMKKTIEFKYVKNGKTYTGIIDRSELLDKMSKLTSWYPDCNTNAKKLCKLIPDIDCIKINQDTIDTQDVPFIEYTTNSEPQPNILKIILSPTSIFKMSFITFSNVSSLISIPLIIVSIS